LNDEASDEAPSVKAKFTDFKVYMDSHHASEGVANNLLPLDNATTGTDQTAVVGEWVMSKQVIPKTDGTDGVNNFEIIWTGENYPGAGASGLDSVSLIEGYAASRGLPDIRDPNAPADAYDAEGPTPENWMSATFNEGTTQDDRVLQDLVQENNEAPYPFENDGTHTDTMYPGGANQLPNLELHYPMQIAPTTVSGLNTAPGGNFQGGLIRVQYSIAADEGVTAECMLLVHLVPGNHRGYLCEPMQDV
jgi:hypothetical protein